MSDFNLLELLEYIPCADLNYSEWVNIGMALKTEGYDVSDWENWSQHDSRYKEGECMHKWRTFRGEGFTGATITQMAKDRGWEPKGGDRVFDWGDSVSYDGNTAAFVQEEIFEPEGDWNQKAELIRYINTLFDNDDFIAFTSQARQDEDGKWKPASKGTYAYTAGQILQNLQSYDTIEEVIGDYNKEAGVWIRFNPLDGKGIGNSNVTEYRYALVESDSMEIEKQAALIRDLQLPVAVMMYSGGKSIHAIVKVNASDEKEYRERVLYIYQVCKKHGLIIDEQNKNASRLSRMPGVYRGDKKQYIIDTNFGQKDFVSWKEYIEGINDDLPDFEPVTFQKPELAPELIEGIVRCGHKMLIQGPSKAGKSFLLIELCVCIANGIEWLGKKTMQGKVLYINLELDKNSCMNRIIDVAQELPADPELTIKNMDVWNLRGKAVPLDKLTPKLIRRARDRHYAAIVIDPIYKVITGDENTASDMAMFCNNFDKICTELQTTAIYVHHHSKGSQSHKSSMDRGSGSGVFARDPDALLDMIEIEPKDANITLGDDETAWRISGIVREFKSMKPFEVVFSYPVHKVDPRLAAVKEKYTGDAKTNSDRGNAAKQEKRDMNIMILRDHIENFWEEHHYYPSLTAMSKSSGIGKSTIQKWFDSNLVTGYGIMKDEEHRNIIVPSSEIEKKAKEACFGSENP